MHIDDVLPVRMAHLVEDDVAQYAGVVDQNVDAAEGIERRLDDLLGIFRLGNRKRGGDGLAAGFLDEADSFLRGTFVMAGAVAAGANVADHHARVFGRQQHGNATADAAPCPGDNGGFAGDDARHYLPQISSESSTIIRSLAHCSSSASTLPSSVEAKPHCGERQSCSSATNLVASWMRFLISSRGSSRPDLEVTRPSTTILLPFGRKRSGSKPPARSLSYSRK